MDAITIARALHVAAIVHWIGGVAMVTAVILPAVRRRAAPEDRLHLFEAIEGRFAAQARVSTLIAGLSGLYMTHQMNAWDRFLEPGFWWMHAMAAIWLIFTAMLFVLEPLFLHRWFHERAAVEPERTFALIQKLHWVLLSLSGITVVAAVLGAHGMLY